MSYLSQKITFAFLWAAVTFSAVSVVWSTHEDRSLINELLSLRSDANAMLVEHGQLLLQEQSLTSAAGLELVAVERLGLHFPSENNIEVLLP